MKALKALLMVLFLAAGSWYLFVETKESERHQAEKARKDAPERLMPAFDETLIEKISVVTQKANFSLVHPAKGESHRSPWVLAQPRGALVDPERLKTVLSSLEGLVARNVLQENEVEETVDYGLEPPKLAISVWKNGKARTLGFGNKHPLSTRRYLEVQDDPRVFLVDERAFDLLNLAADDIRDRRPLRQDLSRVVRVTVKRAAGTVTFERGPDKTSWTVKTPNDSFPADPALFRERLERFLSVKVEEFVDDPELLEAGYARARLVLTLWLGTEGESPEKPGVQIDVHEGADLTGSEVYFTDLSLPFVYRSARAFHNIFLKSPELFRDRQPFRGMTPDDIESLAVRWSDGHTKEIGPSKPAEWGSDLLRNLREMLLSLEIVSFESPTPEAIQLGGLGAPEVEVTFKRKGAAKAYRVVFGKEVEMQEEGGDASGKPRMIGVQSDDSVLRPAILGSGGNTRSRELFEALKR